ncbi:MAG: hypothetical protein AVO35_11045 [Candidatus Aegiribacteria sp. MLS_C]|nr:MAG: hypothetical protein AVO35_11045 [Candidatus Aegiribacteria sp. MLS_C]
MPHPLEKVLEWRERGIPCCLLLAAVTEGSGPGTAGSMMAVSGTGSFGTVGGGPMEEDLVRRARMKLILGGSAPEAATHHHSPGLETSSGMVCSGSQITLLLPVTAGVAAAADKAVRIIRSGSTGRLRVTESGISVAEGDPPAGHSFTLNGDEWEYSGPFGIPDTVYIIGGGHVGGALARLLDGLPFVPVILDPRDRDYLGDPPPCRWIVSEWLNAYEHVPPGERSWVAVMTPGHDHDAGVLRSLFGMELRYLGLMAGRSTKEEIYSRLIEEGVSEEFLRGIHCPIGLPIGSRTPCEIAVSIAAELVGIRSGTRS